ncbi:ABC transporter permease [bacterium]|nr:ABC transporter permease [bacterium]
MRKYVLKAIAIKEMKEYFRNPATITMVIMAVGLVTLIGKVIGASQLFMAVLYPMVFLGLYNVAFLFAEEKEKKTLDAILLSPAGFGEILLGKLFFHLVITISITILLVVSFHFDEISIIHTFLALTLGSLCLSQLGTVIGIICPTQSMVGVVTTIFMLTFLMSEALSGFNNILAAIARSLPTFHVLKIIDLGLDNRGTIFYYHYIFLIIFIFLIFFWTKSFLVNLCKQESSIWKFSKTNLALSIILALYMAFSSFFFMPVKGKIIHKNGISYYENIEYGLTFPVNDKIFEMKEIRITGKLFITFDLKDQKDSRLFIHISRNKENLTPEKAFEKRLDTLKKENVTDLQTLLKKFNGLKCFRAEYKTKNGFYVTYIITTSSYIFKVGAKTKENTPETLGIVKSELEKNINEIQIQK